MLRPFLGSPQLDATGAPPRLRTRSKLCWRGFDRELAPRNVGMRVSYVGRSVPATVYARNGTSGALGASAPAFSFEAWAAAGVRADTVLELSDEEALRFDNASSEELLWTPGALTIRLEGIERGNALVEDAPYFSYTNDEATDAWFAVLGLGGGTMGLVHYNGTSTVVSPVAIAPNQRFSFIGTLYADGRVRSWLAVDNAVTGVSATAGALSAALAMETSWGNGAGCKARVNEFGDAITGVQALRYLAVYDGVRTRRDMLEVI